MSRPLRLELAGALYHITSRGDGQEAIYLDDRDRTVFLATLAHTCERYGWICHKPLSSVGRICWSRTKWGQYTSLGERYLLASRKITLDPDFSYAARRPRACATSLRLAPTASNARIRRSSETLGSPASSFAIRD